MTKGAPDYSKIVVLKGIDENGDYQTVLVDTGGNILAVLKGDYQGTLKTLATDDQGRLLAKIYDPDDLFGSANTLGLGELAARLGSPMTYDRRGQVIWADDMTGAAIHFDISLAGTGAAVAYDTTVSRNGDQSLKLTKGRDSSEYFQIQHSEQALSSGRIGVEIGFSLPISNALQFLTVNVLHDAITTRITAAMRYDWNTKVLQYKDSNGAWVTLASGISVYKTPNSWNRMKFVYDWDTQTYVRAMFQGIEYDMSAIACRVTAAASTTKIYLYIEGVYVNGANDYCYLSSVILTGAEP